jgi:hypothetical protein
VKWFFLNTKRRLQHAFSNPRYAATIVLREATWADERFLAIVTGSSAWRIRKFLDEPAHAREFMQHLSGSEGKLHTAPFESADLYANKVMIQCAIRAMRPDVVVETGIANGVSSAYVLLALKKNGNGVLHSIEIGDSSYLPANCEPGGLYQAGCDHRGRSILATPLNSYLNYFAQYHQSTRLFTIVCIRPNK